MTEQNKTGLLNTSPAPHIRSGDSIKRIMWTVVIALLPLTAYGIYNFGIPAFYIILVSVLSAVAAEVLFLYLKKIPVTVFDGSAVITGLLVGLMLPIGAPLWIAAIGSVFAVIIAKHLFGGPEVNVFNPALAGIAFIMIFRLSEMTGSWYNFHGISFLSTSREAFDTFLSVNTGGMIAETSALLVFSGGVFLFLRRIITWHIPVAFIGTAFVSAYIYYSLAGLETPAVQGLAHIIQGGFLLGVFFMATDPVTSPVTPRGMMLFGAGCGLLTIFITILWGYPEGIIFSILLMNAALYLIGRFRWRVGLQSED